MDRISELGVRDMKTVTSSAAEWKSEHPDKNAQAMLALMMVLCIEIPPLTRFSELLDWRPSQIWTLSNLTTSREVL
jgi:hypothetical protein